MQSCNIAKHIPKDSLLLEEVNIKGAPAVAKGELDDLLQQRPNEKLFGVVRFRMWRNIIFKQEQKNKKKIVKAQAKVDKLEAKYQQAVSADASGKKLQRIDRRLDKKEEKVETLKRKEFEDPVLFDSIKTQSALDQMEGFLFNWGWFNNSISYEMDTVKDVKAEVTYTVEPGNPFYVRSFDRRILDSTLIPKLKDDSLPQPLRKGLQYNGDSLAHYRDDLTKHFRESGYFNFSRDYITYEVDSNLTGDSVNVGMTITNPVGRNKHRIFMVNDVYVEPEYFISDTDPKDSFAYEDFVFISRALSVKPKIIADYVFFRKGQLYQASDYQQTLNRLAQLNIYKFVDIQFVQDTANRPDTGLLNVFIRLTPMDRKVIGADLTFNRVEQSAGQFVNSTTVFAGVASSLYYINRNLAKSVMQFELRPRASIDVPITSFGRKGNILDSAVYEYGATASLIIPRLWGPTFMLKPLFRENENILKFDSRTSFNLSYLKDYTLFFKRNTLNLNWTYQWKDPFLQPVKGLKIFKTPVTFRNVNIFLTPIEISYIDADFRNNRFRDEILKSGDPLLVNLYDPHIITDTKLTFLINQQPLTTVKDRLWLFRTSMETGGLTFGFIDRVLLGSTKQAKVLDALYYNYLRIETDLRNYQPLGNTNLVTRLFTGVGVPIFNSDNLPFEKRFYVGGSNSMRAWRLRELGPGRYNDTTDDIRFDRTGDLRIEANIEYRFPIYSIFNAAVFTDIGNVWTLRGGSTDENDYGVFKFNQGKFINDLAIAGGLGLRMDLSFFVIRLDLAIPLRDPAIDPDLGDPNSNDKWVYQNFNGPWFRNNIQLNIGVGYPF